MLSLREYMLLESCNYDYDYILEALGGSEIRKNLEISEISAKDVEKLIMSKEYGEGKQFGINNTDEIWAFEDVTHYTFKYKGDILAIVGVKKFYDLLKVQKSVDDIIAAIIFTIPLLVLNDISLENISLQYIFNAVRHVEKSEDEFIKKMHDMVQKIQKNTKNDKKSEYEIIEKMYDLIKKSLYVCELQINKETIKKHDLSIIAPVMIVFDWVKKYSNDNYILCGGKDERTANMYKKVGKFWNITLNDKYSKKISEYVKNWSEKDYNSRPDKDRHSVDEFILQDFEENIKFVCILEK